MWDLFPKAAFSVHQSLREKQPYTKQTMARQRFHCDIKLLTTVAWRDGIYASVPSVISPQRTH